MTFEEPRGALVGIAALLPVFAFLIAHARAGAVARALALTPRPRRATAGTALVATAACLLLALAAARPALVGGGEVTLRTDSEVLFIVDVSRSMLASAGPGDPSRLERARRAARALRESVPAVPAALAGLTDRVLPYAFASADLRVFGETLARSVHVESPPPRGRAVVATDFDALAITGRGYFPPGVSRRTCVVLTDGESRPFAARLDRACRFLIVRVGSGAEQMYRAAGIVDRSYVPDPGAAANVSRLARALGGRAWNESELEAAAAALRGLADVGPSRTIRADDRNRGLAVFPAVAALALTLVLATRTLRRHRLASPEGLWSRSPAST